MMQRYPPNRMLSLLLILLIMLCYFSFDLHSRNSKKLNPVVPQAQKLAEPQNQNQTDNLKQPQDISSTEAEGGRPEYKTIQPGAVIIMEKKFSKCGHFIRKTLPIPNDMVNLTQKQLELAYKSWVIKQFSPKEIIIYQEINSKCPNHFVLKNKDGFVTVYYQNPINGITLKEVTPIIVNSLPLKDRERLSIGIKAESRQELAQVLEDLGS